MLDSIEIEIELVECSSSWPASTRRANSASETTCGGGVVELSSSRSRSAMGFALISITAFGNGGLPLAARAAHSKSDSDSDCLF